ncbi:MAG: two-component system sensor histidine kinase/response regulator [Myxococcota bacterium]
MRKRLKHMSQLTELLENSIDTDNYAAEFKTSGRDEIADLAAAFTRMNTTIRGKMEQLKKAHTSEREANHSKSEFLANMSHEIRTPMNGIAGISELLLDTKMNAEQRDFVETINRSAQALMIIINDILDFSKIEAGKVELESIDFNLREIVEDTASSLAPTASSKGLELLVDMSKLTLEQITGDPGRLRQVLSNLIGNAIKFTEKGEVTVKAFSIPNNKIRFEIIDSGIGIEAQALSKLFTEFTQADASTTRRFGGTGLGLSISRQLTELMGGEIGVESTPKKGSMFWFTVEMKATSDNQEDYARDDLEDLNILCVDNNSANLINLRKQLSVFGAQVFVAESAEQAFEVLRRERIDRLLVDYQMPEENGITFARRLRENGEFDNLKIILLSAMGEHSQHPTDLSEIIDASLVKPVRGLQLVASLVSERAFKLDISELLADVEAAMGAKPAQQEESLMEGVRVLLAEDNAINQKVAVKMLSVLGCQVDVVKNGIEAAAAVKDCDYDIVFMDCQMPKLDGYGATREIRSYEGGRRRVSVVAMTANAMEGDREKCIAAGMDDYVAKPINRNDLAAIVSKWKNC